MFLKKGLILGLEKEIEMFLEDLALLERNKVFQKTGRKKGEGREEKLTLNDGEICQRIRDKKVNRKSFQQLRLRQFEQSINKLYLYN